jgi:uncharacterized protein YecE (DUF72 family)
MQSGNRVSFERSTMPKTELRLGTSGFSYVPWKGVFYPEKIKNDAMLKFYAGIFNAVEINNTFYRLPSESMLSKWSGEVPTSFRFCLKMSQRVTHHAKLVETQELTDRFFSARVVLGETAGPSLIQLPPYLKKDVARLQAFLTTVPNGQPLVFEFGSQTWMDDEVYAVLRERGASVCLVDDEKRPFQWVQTAPFGYVRLRQVDYTEAALTDFWKRAHDVGWQTLWVFFKHEDAGTGPRFGQMLKSIAGQ